MTETRNIVDFYHYWEHAKILANLDEKRFNYSILCCNINYDFNVAGCIRSSNAFLAKEVILYGNKKFDRRGAVGTHHYTNFKHVKRTDDLDTIFSSYDCIIGVDNVPNAKPIDDFVWNKDKKTLIAFGEEQVGLAPEILKRCHEVIYIRQFGSVRSLNVAAAASIVMFDYTSKVTKQ